MTHRTQPKVHEKQQGALSNTPESARVVASFFLFRSASYGVLFTK